MEIWEELVCSDTIPTETNAKLVYNAKLLTASVLAQEYHVMIQEGLEYSYVSNGFAVVLLRVLENDPGTLYYYLCEPILDLAQDSANFQQEKTAVAIVLCLCLMSLQSRPRSNQWRYDAKKNLPLWKRNFDHTRSQIPDEELEQPPPGSDYQSPEKSGSEYLPSSPISHTPPTSRMPTRSKPGGCAPEKLPELEPTDSESDSNQATSSRKRGFSQVSSSPTSPSTSQHQVNQQGTRGGQFTRKPPVHTAQYCTQACLLGLQRGGKLDDNCPNVSFHRQGQPVNTHLINAEQMVQGLKEQLNIDLDSNITPFSECGSFGAPFKLTYGLYGYTVVGKGTTERLGRRAVSKELDIYRILHSIQGTAVPVCLGSISLEFGYFLHGAGNIRHLLILSWGGEEIERENIKHIHAEYKRSERELRSLGVLHQDLRLENILWNPELKRVLIIDFHQCRLARNKPVDLLKRPIGAQKLRDRDRDTKRLKLSSQLASA
ncbi:hypothetical protein FQN57_004675 [Myotisia sp. PD_48]|nr:hypothetical protein FQN57_004675 [Myotisia sp. PD_48]